MDIDSFRPEGAEVWTLPEWGHDLATGVFPLLITTSKAIQPIGTAFCVSRLGIICTAFHNVAEAYRTDKGISLKLSDPIHPAPSHASLTSVGLSVLHIEPTGPTTGSWTIWPAESFNASPPTDLLFGFITFRENVLRANLVLSYAVPRIGSKVRCIGYSKFRPDGGLPTDAIGSGDSPVGPGYGHEFGVVEATVTHIFTKEFTAGFGGGPCFAIDREVPHGYSGGPVLNSEGNVCGVVSSGATAFFGSPSSIVAMLYPAMHTPIHFGATNGSVTLKGLRSPSELIQLGLISTDGTENHAELTNDGPGGLMIGTRVHIADGPHVFENFRAFQEGRPAPPLKDD